MQTWTANPPRILSTWEMSGKKSRQQTEERKEWFKERRKPKNSIQAATWKACVLCYCGVCFMIVYQIDCVTFNRTLETNHVCSIAQTKPIQRYLFSASTHVHLLLVKGYDVVCWFVQLPHRLVSITRLRPQQCFLHQGNLTSFHFSISLSSTAGACFFIFLFPANDRKRLKCEIRKSVCK